MMGQDMKIFRVWKYMRGARYTIVKMHHIKLWHFGKKY